MYPTSSLYQEYIHSRVRKSIEYYGTITQTDGRMYSFGNSDILSGAGNTITKQCSGDMSIDIGAVYASELVLSLIPNDETLDIDRYSINKAVIDLYAYVEEAVIRTWEEAEPFTWSLISQCTWGEDPKIISESIPMGVFTVTEAMRSMSAIKITAYDDMVKFEKDLPSEIDTVSRSVYQWLRYICIACNVSLGMTAPQVRDITNGNMSFSYAEVATDVKTYRDLLSLLCQATASVAVFGRQGRLVLINYSMTVDDVVDSSFRYKSDFSDFQSWYTGLSASYKAGAVTEYFKNAITDSGLVYDLGYNGFLQISNERNRKAVLQTIIDAQKTIKYTPFKVEMPTNPAYDLMDVIQFTDNQTTVQDIAPLTKIIFNLGGKMEISCGGSDPALAEVRTRETKAIEGLANNNSVYAGNSDFWILTDSFPDNATAIEGTDTVTTETLVQTTVDVTRTQIAWKGTYTLTADSTVTAKVLVDGTEIYHVSEFQNTGINSLGLVTGYDIEEAGEHTVKIMLAAVESASNQFSFSKVKVGQTVIEAEQKNDTLELIPDGAVTMTADATDDSVTIGVDLTEIEDELDQKLDIVDFTKANIGLGNADNTSDANKPVSTAQQAALDLKQDTLTFDNTPIANSNNPVKSGGVKTALDAKAPTSHASSATTYGIGNASNYGHVKLSDTYNSNVGAAANGLAASQKALFDVYSKIPNVGQSYHAYKHITSVTTVTLNVTNGTYLVFHRLVPADGAVNSAYRYANISGVTITGGASGAEDAVTVDIITVTNGVIKYEAYWTSGGAFRGFMAYGYVRLS